MAKNLHIDAQFLPGNSPFSQNKDINTTQVFQEPQWTVVDSWC